MAFCKICACGEKIVFERRMIFPSNCPSCGRRLNDFRTYTEDDPAVEELLHRAGQDGGIKPESGSQPAVAETGKTYVLKLFNGKEIIIPKEGGIIGRTEIGAEELAEFPSVSRQHLRVTIRRVAGLLVEDISSYGTLVDGKRLPKNETKLVKSGAKITLCNVEAQLMTKEKAES